MSTTGPNAPASKSPFWQFSIRFYAVPGVADARIALRDRAKVDVKYPVHPALNSAGTRRAARLQRGRIQWRSSADRSPARYRVVESRFATSAARWKLPPGEGSRRSGRRLRSRIRKVVELEAERLRRRCNGPRRGAAGPAVPIRRVEAARDSVASYQGVLGSSSRRGRSDKRAFGTCKKFDAPGSNSGYE